MRSVAGENWRLMRRVKPSAGGVCEAGLGESVPAKADRGPHERWVERGGALRKQMWREVSLERRTEMPAEFKDLRGGALRQQIRREVSLERWDLRPADG